MVDYKKTKIYYIAVGNDKYYGHTTQLLCERKKGHKRDAKRRPNTKLYQSITDAGLSYTEIKLVWVEDYPCDTKEQALARERYYVEQFATLNTEIPGRTKKEYREANKDAMVKKRKDYYENNKEKERERKAKFYAENKEAILQKYHENNEEKNAKRRARYALKDKDALNAARREKRANSQQS
jgi:hypothetical protein